MKYFVVIDVTKGTAKLKSKDEKEIWTFKNPKGWTYAEVREDRGNTLVEFDDKQKAEEYLKNLK